MTVVTQSEDTLQTKMPALHDFMLDGIITEKENLLLFKELIAEGEDVNAQDKQGCTLLHHLLLLLDDCEAIDQQIHLVSPEQDLDRHMEELHQRIDLLMDLFYYLMEHGANPMILDHDGDSVHDLYPALQYHSISDGLGDMMIHFNY